jgi:hypothetical protein
MSVRSCGREAASCAVTQGLSVTPGGNLSCSRVGTVSVCASGQGATLPIGGQAEPADGGEQATVQQAGRPYRLPAPPTPFKSLLGDPASAEQ